jgi:FSR family fosmidomycin resistance protein-like MFS transporter
VSGAWTAAWPLIRTDLGLSYVEIGVLLSLPSVFGSALEPPLALLGEAGHRRALMRTGGVALALALLLAAVGEGFFALLLALMIASPASGVFVGLAQTLLMDADPARHEQNMARWVLAGSLGMAAGPATLVVVLWLGLGWRAAFAAFGAVAIPLVIVMWRMPMPVAPAVDRTAAAALLDAAKGALVALRRRAVLRWLTLLQFSDLMLDVLHGLLALYFVDVARAGGTGAALAIAVWTGIGLVGDGLAVALLERVLGTRWVRAGAAALLLVFPAFLLVDSTGAKLALLAAIALLNSGWYSVLQGRLYSELPGRSATVMALASTFGIAGGLIPLGVSAFAERFGLGPAMWLLLAGPVALLIGLPRDGAAQRPSPITH